MYESFYGLKEKPFSLLPDPAYLFLSKQHEMAITLLEYSLENQAGFCVITGKAGTGKTTLLRRLLNQIGDDVSVGLISNTHHSFGELLRWILHAFDLKDAGKNRAQQHQTFVDYLIGQYAKKRRTMLIIDEAQNMSPEALEELRMLSNINSEKDLLLQVILVGQPPLREILRRPELEQFAQRIAVDYHLDSLGREETQAYIRHRVMVAGGERELFSDDACDAVYGHTGGIPRLINLLCDFSLVYAYAGQGAVVTAELVEQVVSEREKYGALPVFAKGEPVRRSPRTETAPRTAAAKTHHTAATHSTRKLAGSTTATGAHAAHTVTGYGKTSGPASSILAEGRIAATQSTADRGSHKMVVTLGCADVAVSDGHAPGSMVAAFGSRAARQPPDQSGSKAEAVVANVFDAAAESIAGGAKASKRVEAVTVTPLNGTKSNGKPGSIVREKTGARSVPSKALPGQTHENLSGASKRGTAGKPSKAIGLPQKTSNQTDLAKFSGNRSTKNANAPDGYAALRQGDRAVSVAKRYIPAAAVIALLLSAAVVWRHFSQPSESTPVVSDSSPSAPATTMTPVVETTPTNVTPVNEPASQAMPEEKSSPAQGASVGPAVAEKDPQEEARLKRIERERDAALAKARAVEREREAVRAAAMERERTLAAEHEAALSRGQERMRQLALAAEKAKEQARVAAAAELAERAARAAAAAASAAARNKPEFGTPPRAVESEAGSVMPVASESDSATQDPDAEAGTDEPTLFSANPCKGPSARFLSTCQ